MTCSHCVGAGKIFGERRARREARRFRRRGPAKATQQVIDFIEGQNPSGLDVVDIGAGVGALHISLLERGAEKAVHVDASEAYQIASEREAEARGLAGRVDYVHGDYLDVADQLPEADVVCLDRVICCYPDMGALVRRSAQAAGSMYALVFPLDRFWVKGLMGAANAGLRLLRNPFRTFVHPESEVRRVVEDAGFAVAYQGRAGMWRTLVFLRPPVSQRQPPTRSSGQKQSV